MEMKPKELIFLKGRNKFIVQPTQIVRLESLNNYTRIYFTGHPPVLMAKVLRSYDHQLRPFGFVRPHRSHLINPLFISEVTLKGTIRMMDASIIEPSRRKKHECFSIFSKQNSTFSKYALS